MSQYEVSDMLSLHKAVLLTTVLVVAVFVQALSLYGIRGEAQLPEFSGGIRIYGLVDNPMNLSDADLSAMPKVSEVAAIKCVWGFPEDTTVNWTGIPLFHILLLAEIKSQATKVAFHSRANDFHSDLTIEDALNSSILIATEANGTDLTSLSEIAPDHIGGYRLVVPGRYGYKWVANLGSIEIVDYNYLGTYETSLSMNDTGIIPEFKWTPEQKALLPPVTFPALATYPIPYGNRTFQVQAFTNASVTGFHFDMTQKSVGMNLLVLANSTGFADIIIQQAMITGPYQTFLDENLVSVAEANISGLDFQYLTMTEGMHALRIVGTEFQGDVPTIVIAPLVGQIYVGSAVVFDARSSQDRGVITIFMWDFGDGATARGAVVSHAYNSSGVFAVKVTAFDNFGGMSNKIIYVDVQKQSFDVLVVVGIIFLIGIIIAVAAFGVLLAERKKKT